MPRVVVSFKNTKEELALYDEIMKASDRSAYVKDMLKAYKRMTEPKPNTETITVKRLVRVRKNDPLSKEEVNNVHKTQNEEDVLVQPKVEETPHQEPKIEEIKKVEETIVEDIKTEETKASETSVIKVDQEKETDSNHIHREQRKPRLISYDY